MTLKQPQPTRNDLVVRWRNTDFKCDLEIALYSTTDSHVFHFYFIMLANLINEQYSGFVQCLIYQQEISICLFLSSDLPLASNFDFQSAFSLMIRHLRYPQRQILLYELLICINIIDVVCAIMNIPTKKESESKVV